jgi:hypothetical protein
MGVKVEDDKAVLKRRSVRVSDYDMEKIIRKYGTFTKYINAMIMLNIRDQK